MSLGSRIRELRVARGLTQAQLGEIVGAEGNTVSRWELDKLGMGTDYIIKFAKALKTSTDFLLEETDNPSRSSCQEIITPQEADASALTPFTLSGFSTNVISTDLKGLKKLPLLDNPSCTYIKTADVSSWQIFSAEIYGVFDPKQPPFIVRAPDDSMEGAGIPNGALVVVNPAEEVRDGEVALVRWPQSQAAIKLVYWLPSGGVELRSANPNYQKVYTFTKDDRARGTLQVRGRVMWAAARPKRMV